MQTALITGVSRGLGHELLKLLAIKHPNIKVIGTVRQHPNQLQANINQQFQLNNVTIMQLDLNAEQSIQLLVEKLQAQSILIDAVINNAAISPQLITPSAKPQPIKDKKIKRQMAIKAFASNFYGTVSLSTKLIPLLKDDGRIINISSGLGALKRHSKEIQEIFSNPVTCEDIDFHIKKYIAGIEKGEEAIVYQQSIYGTSKMLLNAWNRFILPYYVIYDRKQLKGTQQAIAMSPGHCKTDMGGSKAPRSAEDGALSIYKLLWGQYSHQQFYHSSGVTDYTNCVPIV